MRLEILCSTVDNLEDNAIHKSVLSLPPDFHHLSANYKKIKLHYHSINSNNNKSNGISLGRKGYEVSTKNSNGNNNKQQSKTHKN